MSGFDIHLTYLWLETPQEAVERVLQRVSQGGHFVPEEVIVRRYRLGLKNLIKHYLPLANSAVNIDNSTQDTTRRIVGRKDKDGSLSILNHSIWKKIESIE